VTRALAATVLVACGPRAELPPRADGSVARVVVDTRLPAAFAAGHAPGALNLQVGWGQLAARIGQYLPDRDTPVALRATDPAEAARAAEILRERGYADIALAAPREAATEAAEGGLDTLPLMTAAELRARLAGPDPPIVLDVRSRLERAVGAVPGSAFVDEETAPRPVGMLDRDREYAVICEGGWRSSQLASWMRREGFTHVVNVIDGMAGWRAGE
jgi:rhodanese-related sulfurtransferase